MRSDITAFRSYPKRILHEELAIMFSQLSPKRKPKHTRCQCLAGSWRPMQERDKTSSFPSHQIFKFASLVHVRGNHRLNDVFVLRIEYKSIPRFLSESHRFELGYIKGFYVKLADPSLIERSTHSRSYPLDSSPGHAAGKATMQVHPAASSARQHRTC